MVIDSIKKEKSILLCAGGTGGHLFPAQALADELGARGWKIYLATDNRAQAFCKNFPSENIYCFSSATARFKNPLAVLKAFFTILRGINQARVVLRSIRPCVVVGFGGYPSFPPVFASFFSGIPSILHEQNAVMGRANKLLSPLAKLIAKGFPHRGDKNASKIIVTGNPVRSCVLDAAQKPYISALEEDVFRLLIFGGSQGAHFFSQLIPQALALLSPKERKRIHITQQVRLGEEDALKSAYSCLDVCAEISSFFFDMPERIAQAHLIVSRSGASTVSEIQIIGRPSILVPYPYALDHDQKANASHLVEQGGAEMHIQSTLTPKKMADILLNSLHNPEKLSSMAQKTKSQGKPEASRLLADLVEATALKNKSYSKKGM